MKMKFTAALALAIWLLVTGWLATMVIVKPAVLHLGNDADDTAAMGELRAAIERNRRAQAHIAALGQASYREDGRQLVALQPLPRVVEASSGIGGEARVDAGPVQHNVAMVLETNGRRSAIVNGELVRAGSLLADGSRVRAIGQGAVRIERADGERTDLRVPSALLQQAARSNAR
ncbi:hypothetical protein PQS31_03665 [Luteimonas sp BLCC-B24]|uniref:hypothetical protein n=1 Tax=Luteimonas sp. BLCC-B24 TaxID=3025317 RepID=UPI00234CE33D|nr:hypothetical protein [Luteimonas sp. BLCC-B24]MDC7805919.1 hypothetical protein [Luteimonas sp. BLCC-B24]